MSFSQGETGKDSVQMSAAGITGSAEPTSSDGRREPETIRISLPALRAILMATFYDGDPTQRIAGLSRCEPWELDHAFPDVANDCRMRFCDEIERRLRQLPARG